MDSKTTASVKSVVDQVADTVERMEQSSKQTDASVEVNIEAITSCKHNFFEIDRTHWAQSQMESEHYLVNTTSQSHHIKERIHQKQQRKQNIQNLQADISANDAQVAAWRKINETLHQETLHLDQRIPADVDKISSRRQAIAQKDARLARHAKSERKVIDEYQNILGLSVDVVEDHTLEFTFTCIDNRDPHLPFKVNVSSQNDSFQALKCVPMIAEFDQLSRALESGDIEIVTFIRKIRKGFMNHAQAANSWNR